MMSMDAMVAPTPDARDADEDAGREPAQPVDAGSDAGDAGGRCASPAVDSYCDHIPALPAAPVIDGELDCGAPLLPMQAVAWNGPAAMPSDHSTRIAAAWRSNGLYLYVEVEDPTIAPHPSGAIYCGDAVELYVDADATLEAAGHYDNPGTMQFIVAAPSESSPTDVEALRFVSGTQSDWTAAMLATAVHANGYAVEVFLTAADLNLGQWSPMTRIGLDVALDVSGTSGADCGNKIGQYFMKVDTGADSPRAGEPWGNTLAFCTPALDPAP
jgi:hypothetical protein